MRIFSGLIIFALLAGCGAYEERAVGIEEDTTLIIRGETLVGLTVSIDDAFSMVVTEEDLTKFKMGILGVSNREVEDLQTITLKVDTGTRRVRVAGSSGTLVERELHFGQGQTRELRVRQ